MTSPYKMLVIDLDGTALNHESQLTERDIAAAHALREAGVELTIATGRLFTGTRWVAEQLGIEGAVAVVNGSELIDVTSGAAVHGTYVDAPARMRARELLRERDLTTFLFGSRRIHYDREDQAHTPYLGIWTPELQAHDDIFAAPAWDDEDIVAVAAVGDAGTIDDARTAMHAELSDELGTFRFHTFKGDAFVKLRHHGENKGSALRRMAALRGVTAAETVAMGDWLNDLPMFEAAGLSFAMGHAMADVKAAADEILGADRHSGGGIAEVAERVWDIKV